VIAECQFSGVQYHLVVESRLEEIRRECKELAGWFSRREARSAALNAEMYILNSLARTLEDNNQFDEEQVCMNRVRHLHNRLWAGLRPHRWVVYPLLAYSEFVMGSFAKFAFALLLWITVLIAGYWGATDVPPPTAHIHGSPGAFLSVMNSFTGASVPDGLSGTQAAVLIASAIVGLSHLGVFISYLYSRVARK
jgi:hypothetical protein